MFDTFIAELRCPRCGTVSPAGAGNMQTHLLENGDNLPVGFLFEPIDLKTEYVIDAGYLLIREPTVGGTIRLLDTWGCSGCVSDQWAVVEIVDMRIERIEAVSMNRETLEAANFISDMNAEFLAARLSDDALDLDDRQDIVEILRERLA